jgi:hypothetical protein
MTGEGGAWKTLIQASKASYCAGRVGSGNELRLRLVPRSRARCTADAVRLDIDRVASQATSRFIVVGVLAAVLSGSARSRLSTSTSCTRRWGRIGMKLGYSDLLPCSPEPVTSVNPDLPSDEKVNRGEFELPWIKARQLEADVRRTWPTSDSSRQMRSSTVYAKSR